MQWDSLEPYFLSNFDLGHYPTENDTDEIPSRENRLVNAFRQTVSKSHAMLMQSVILIFDSFNTFMQAEESLIHIFYHATLRLYRSLLSSYLRIRRCAKGAYTKYAGGGPEGFTNFSKNIRSPGDHRPKYFTVQ